MLNKIIHFIKYNNAVVFIALFVFVLGSGVFASTETGQELIGQKQTRQEGVDNTLLLEVDLDNFDMEFQIEKIEEDEFYYYVTYTYLDLVKEDEAWQYQVQEKIRKVTKLLKRDLGEYIAEELEEQYQARVKDLWKERSLAEQTGESTRVELSEYNGLIGQSLGLVAKIFPDYEAVKKTEIPSPSLPALLTLKTSEDQNVEQIEDSIADVYNDYISQMDADQDDVFGTADNCPLDHNPLQEDQDLDGIGDLCDYRDDLALTDEQTEKDATGTDPTINPEETDSENNQTNSSGEITDQIEGTQTEIDTSESTAEDAGIVIEEPVLDETVEVIPEETVEIIEINQ